MFFFSSRRRHTRCGRDWSSDVCSSDLESSFLDQLISELSKMNKQTSLFFSKLSKEKFLREGCKSDLLDLRINIRSMRETIGDIDSKLVNIDEETDALLNDLLAQF